MERVPAWAGQGGTAVLLSMVESHQKEKKKKVSINFSNHFLPKIQLIFKIKPKKLMK